jgi:V-type H+-transporting ATPase subunit a
VAESRPAPSLISLLITFFMQPGDVPPEARLYSGQEYVQLLLLTLAFIAVPWMLLAKPLLLRRRHQAALGYKTVHARDADVGRSLLRGSRDDDTLSTASSHNGKLHAEEFDFMEIMVHQVSEPPCPPAKDG